ncbi:phosphate ABC transporter substrate-binding protein, PhoT family [Cyanobacterium stanieri PCC 7202]|uniref:Phosphate-binding protein n=1 Tax=Cyanobacterium stanieri (strain ATCC 29140 / PCC 7202) TaxID=292563 RepID=K9YRI8_CYASC|nr:phosphate ABC transporter substrate-binding protein, PhoT family [Cyanobacterium stanieri PCC 7202]
MITIQRRKFNQFFLLLLALGFLTQACGNTNAEEPKSISIDGSSTVFPITDLITKNFNQENEQGIDVNVGFSGSVGGFRKFCNGETDINNASVPIPKEAMEECRKNGIAYIELPVAFDALTVVVNPNNNWVNSMTVEELKTIWQPSAENQIVRWNQINPSWVDNTLNLFAPGRDSGTFEYFTEAIVGERRASRNDYVFSEDDDALVNGVAQDNNALGYFGYAYYEQNQDKLKALGIDSGEGAVFPSDQTIIDNTYRPLTRPLFIYVNAKNAQENSALKTFVEYYLRSASGVVREVGYLPLPDSAYEVGLIHFNTHQVGTVFNGEAVFNVSINELLSKAYAQDGEDGYVF